MRRGKLWLSGAIVLLIVACGGPGPVTEPTSLLTDADLDSAEAIGQASATELGAASLEAVSTAQTPDTGRHDGAPVFSDAAIAAAAKGEARGQQDLGGWLAYIEQRGKTYSIRLVDLNDENSPERRGDYVAYKGTRAIQSVAVSRDGKTVAFVAETKDGDYDVFLLDPQRNKVYGTRTPGVDERDVSMSLDGNALAWQGGTPDAPTLAWFHEELGGYVEFDTAAWTAVTGIPLASVQPSVSGDGLTVVFIDLSGALTNRFGYGNFQGLATVGFKITDGVPSLTGLTLFYYGDDLRTPSLSYDADKLLFVEIFGQTPFLSMIDREAGSMTDLIGGALVDHPYLTADGDYVTFSAFGNAYTFDVATQEMGALSPSGSTVDTGTYWARGNFDTYSGTNDQGTFVRPGDDLATAGRTVGYHVHEFRPIVDDLYAIESVQNYDGFLNLYAGNFNPDRPERDLIASNDDWLGPWDDSAKVGTSRIVTEMSRNTKYYIVTSACGAPGTPCGPSEGFFRNTISGNATPPPPPTQLPEPDPNGYDISLRFWDGNFTPEEEGYFQEAAARLSEIIVGDVTDIPSFNLTETQTTSGAPGLTGTLDDIHIDVAKYDFGDGNESVLARAGFMYYRSPESPVDPWLPAYGIMEFNAIHFEEGGFYFDDIEGLKSTILHEMAHVLGISRSQWTPRGLIEGNPTTGCSDAGLGHDPRYLGASGNGEWVNTYGATTSTVPIANTNGCGTADSHWREIVLQDEFMTGFAGGGAEPISTVTIGAFEDLGYVVDYTAADMWSIPPQPILELIEPVEVSFQAGVDFGLPMTGSARGAVTAPVTVVDPSLADPEASTSACEAEDFAGFPAGNIALVQRGTCGFAVKAQNAINAGASAVIVANTGTPTNLGVFSGTLSTDMNIVVIPVAFDVLVQVQALSGAVMHLDTDPGGAALIGPSALPKIDWHINEQLLEPIGTVDPTGKITRFGE